MPPCHAMHSRAASLWRGPRKLGPPARHVSGGIFASLSFHPPQQARRKPVVAMAACSARRRGIANDNDAVGCCESPGRSGRSGLLAHPRAITPLRFTRGLSNRSQRARIEAARQSVDLPRPLPRPPNRRHLSQRRRNRNKARVAALTATLKKSLILLSVRRSAQGEFHPRGLREAGLSPPPHVGLLAEAKKKKKKANWSSPESNWGYEIQSLGC